MPAAERPARCASAARGLAAAALLAAALAGCAKPLFSETDERSPFDRFDRVRNQYVEQYKQDPFGRNQPNLRARLTPRS